MTPGPPAWFAVCRLDGGIGPATIEGAAAHGANVLVAGSALFRDPDGLEHAVTDLRTRAESTRPS